MGKPFVFSLSLAVTIAVTFGILNHPGCDRTSAPAPRIKNTVQLKAIGTVLQSYAQEYGGVLPGRLEEALVPYEVNISILQFIDPSTGEQIPWQFPGAGKTMKALDPKFVLVSSPSYKDKGKTVRLQLMADGSTDIVPQ